MNNLIATALHSMIHRQFELWNAQDKVTDELKNRLFQGCCEKDSRDEVYAKMIINSMEIAADISAKIILEILLTSGVVEPIDEEQIRRYMFSVIQGQKPIPKENKVPTFTAGSGAAEASVQSVKPSSKSVSE